MLVECALGDAYGAGFEFIKRPYPNGMVNDTETYWKHPELEIGGGRYTDDTQMTMAIAEELVEDGPFTKESLADRFVTTFKRDPRKGYGKGMYGGLCFSEKGSDLLALLKPHSTRSGAAMRVGPVGLFSDLETVLEKAALQASVTHDSPEGRMSAQAIAASVHYFAYKRGSISFLGDFLEAHVPGHDWASDHEGWVSVEGVPCAHAAITCVRLGRSMENVLERAIDLGGDVDTVAAMAMFIASVTKLPNDLDSKLYSGLEQGSYGKDYLLRLDKSLSEFASRQGAVGVL